MKIFLGILVTAILIIISGCVLGQVTAREVMVNTDESSIHVMVYGEGPTIIMLPSAGRSVSDFSDLTERLTKYPQRVEFRLDALAFWKLQSTKLLTAS